MMPIPTNYSGKTDPSEIENLHFQKTAGSVLLSLFMRNNELEDLKVLRRSPDLLNNCKTGQGQLQLIMKHILFYHILGLQPFWSSNLNNLTAQ